MSPEVVGPATAYVLHGRVVTMDAGAQVIDEGAIYVRDGTIAEVAPADAPPPPEFIDAPVIATGGTIYPGLIELHNHLSYDALPLWAVPQQYTDRDQWGSGGSNAKVYRQLVSGPMTILGKSPDLSAAVARYVECKALAGGVTTSQGIALFSNAGIPRYYRGALRNVEQTLDPNLPGAHDRIGDVAATDAELFLASLDRYHRVLLHLSEGTDQAAEEHFLSLHLKDGRWAITPSLVGIHSVALSAADFRVMAEHGASVVWSPLSNLLLYGDTMNIASAKEAELPIGLGSDWSPSGSKSLFGELKVARLVSQTKGDVFSDLELLKMTTSGAAAILGWDQLLGSIEKGNYADLVVIFGLQGDPYEKFLTSRETEIELVMVQGVPRLGRPHLMAGFGAEDVETFTIASNPRWLYLKDPAADPLVGGLTFTQAKERLADALNRLPELASQLEHPSSVPKLADANLGETRWFLQLDHDESPGFALRPHLPDSSGFPTAMTSTDLAAASEPLSSVLTPLTLDPLTVADDRHFLTAIGNERNVWPDVKAGLPELYD
jgi:5-methylthioadenosine/S-adenosylhomocysteine deaminase